jgi:hypothetical protein
VDGFNFKSAAIVDILRDDDDFLIEIVNLNVSPNAIWGTNGTAILVEPDLDTGPVVTFDDPLLG